MKAITTLLTVLALCTATASQADDVIIPTDDDHPFDLTKGEVISEKQREHFTQNGVENMYDSDQLVYTLDNRENADFYNFYLEATKGAGTQTIDLSLKSEEGNAVVDTTFAIDQSGIYDLRTPVMKKGRYTLTFTFHQLSNKTWASASIKSISFKIPQSLKPGDEVELLNPEFDNSYDGWTKQGHLWYTPENFGNKYSLAHFNGGAGILSQTAYNLPDGVYLFCVNAYDSYPSLDVAPDTYVFLNDRKVRMKTAFDDAVGYRNIWRWYDSKHTNNNYRHTPDGRWVPTHQVDWNESLAMSKGLYENGVVATVTNGQATFGWQKVDSRSVRIACDHARLIFLSDDVSQPFDEKTLLTAHLRERLTAMEQQLRTELAAKRAHAPQAVAEANAFVNADIAYTSDNEYIDAILHAEHLLQRLQLPFYEVTVPGASPSGLADMLAAKGIQTTDTIALKLNGTLSSEDLVTLKTFQNMMELDLSETTLTALPDNQFNNKLYLLTWVTLPKQLETIGGSTFNDCVELRDMEFPATLKSIGDYAFRYTYNFYRATIPEGVTAGNGAYRNSGIRHLLLPTSMEEVPYILCSDCYDLFDVHFNGQLNIGNSAFQNCYELRSITLPEGMERLKDQCFRYCTGLTKVTLPSTILTTARPFFNCSNLTELTCLAAAPPFANDQSIHGDITSTGFTLYVPQQAVEEYQAANKWSEFNVIGIDALPQTYNVISELTLDMNNAYPSDYKPDISLQALYYYWGGNVSSVGTYGHLTVDGPNTLSASRFQTVWNPYAMWSMANRQAWGTTHTSLINYGHIHADELTVDLRLYEGCWDFIAFPFDVRMGDIRSHFPDTPLAIYGYDAEKRAEGKNSETWVRMTADSILHAGQGYIWQSVIPYHQIAERQVGQDGVNWHFNRFYVDALQNANKPKFFRTDDVEVTLQKHESEYAHERSWNFIGNPYPCYFDLQKIETTAPIIVWSYSMTHIPGQYRAYSPLDDDLILFPGQAFFIQCPLDQDRLVFHKEGRQHDLSLHYDVAEARALKAQGMGSRQVFNLLLSEAYRANRANESYGANETNETQALDRTRFVINQAASLDYEPGRDASKFFSLDAQATHLYTVRNGVQYAIDERPLDNGIIQLGLKTGAEGVYCISLDASRSGEQAEAVFLIDRETGTETNLSATSYTFQISAGIHEGRFLVRLGGNTSGIADNKRETIANNCYYDMQGRRVTQETFTLHSSLKKGIYVRGNQKVIIK